MSPAPPAWEKLLINAMDQFQIHIYQLLFPPLGFADHNTILLAPAYTLVRRRTVKVTKSIKQWTNDSIATLHGCFESTDWDNLLAPCSNISEQVDVVSFYISFCVGNIILTKKVAIFPNNKPAITKELKEILNKMKRVFLTGTKSEQRM